ncbi:MAG: ribonuclease HI family protein [Candidatus Kaiserbacteria bacterium]|nr:ribonuclease HI family protein [Candidatus Kaiserbacteria bacterium]
MFHFTIHADGGARGNPGPAGAGAMIRDELGNAVASFSKFLGTRTNNFAEYKAVILAFEALTKIVPAAKRAGTSIIVKMDSELVVKQMRGEYKVKNATLKEQSARLKQIASAFKSVSFIHVPREENSDADFLANEAMDRGA